MLKKYQIFFGFIGGAVFPLLCGIADWFKLLPILNKPAIPYLLVMLINLFIIRYCFKKGWSDAASGIAISSVIFAVLVYVLKFRI